MSTLGLHMHMDRDTPAHMQICMHIFMSTKYIHMQKINFKKAKPSVHLLITKTEQASSILKLPMEICYISFSEKSQNSFESVKVPNSKPITTGGNALNDFRSVLHRALTMLPLSISTVTLDRRGVFRR